MKKTITTYAITFLPLTCFANTSPQGDDMKILYIIGIVIFFLIFLALIWIRFDTKRDAKKSGASKKLSEEDKSIVKRNQNLQKENAELNQKLKDQKEEIELLTNNLNEKIKENDILRKQIMEPISQSSGSFMSSNESKKHEDHNENAEMGDNANSNPLVGKFNFIEMAVINGNLVKAESEQTTYYRAWREKDQILFEFVNNDRTRKAINNRTIIIEPFCIKHESSKSPDVSEEIETKSPGILNDDFTLRKKAEIIYK